MQSSQWAVFQQFTQSDRPPICLLSGGSVSDGGVKSAEERVRQASGCRQNRALS